MAMRYFRGRPWLDSYWPHDDRWLSSHCAVRIHYTRDRDPRTHLPIGFALAWQVEPRAACGQHN